MGKTSEDNISNAVTGLKEVTEISVITQKHRNIRPSEVLGIAQEATQLVTDRIIALQEEGVNVAPVDVQSIMKAFVISRPFPDIKIVQ